MRWKVTGLNDREESPRSGSRGSAKTIENESTWSDDGIL